MSKESVKKIGLIGCLATGIGSIVGSGIFGSLPTVINSVGGGTVIALILATFYILIQMGPNIYATSALPASGSYFLYSAKLLHPVAGIYMAIANLFQSVLISVFAVLFADYFVALFPGLDGKQVVISAVVLLLYMCLCWFGNKAIVNINSVIVLMMLVAIAVFVIVGMPNIDGDKLTLGEIIRPGVKLSSIAAACSILSSSLSGAGAISQIANDVKNPRKTVPLSMILSPIIVCGIYVFMAVTALGTKPDGDITTLTECGEAFLSPALLKFFIVFGPICGILTSMVPVALMTIEQIRAAAQNGVFPDFCARTNQYNVPYFILAFVMLSSVIISSTGATFGVLMTVFSFVNILSNMPTALIPFVLSKKYPHAAKHGGMSVPKPLAQICGIFVLILSVILAVEAVRSLDSQTIIVLFSLIALTVVYMFARVKYLSKKGRNLFAELQRPYAEWEQWEKEFAEQDAK